VTVAELLAEARAGLDRLAAEDLPVAVRDGAVVVDIRPAAQRAEEGELDGALVIERNVLEWRCDPSSDARTEEAVDHDVAWVVVCSEGYTSSLAAFALKRLGLHRATDLVGGYQALRRADISLH
jgi:rhodanese-related sulfurtransferase